VITSALYRVVGHIEAREAPQQCGASLFLSKDAN
jgi:hypothetical protein